MARSKATTPQVPTTLRLVPRLAEVSYIRHRKPLTTRIREAGNSLATLEDAADWRELSRLIFNDDRLAPDEKTELVRHGNVIELPLPGRRSTSFEIEEVRKSEERRGKRR